MAQSFYPTAQTIIDAALRGIRAVDPDSSVDPNTTQRTNALQTLNFMVTSWQAFGMQVWCQKIGTHTLTASAATYTVGPGGDISIQRPLTVSMAYLRNTNGNDLPMRKIGREEYTLLSAKSATGTPNCFFYDPEYDKPAANEGASAKGKLYLWPVPDATIVAQYDLYFIYTRPIQDFSATSDTLDFPQEWFNAVKWNLAWQIAPDYGVPRNAVEMIKKLADDALELAKSFDHGDDSILIFPATSTSN